MSFNVWLANLEEGMRTFRGSSFSAFARTLLLMILALITGCGGEKKDPPATESLQGTWKIVEPADFPFSQITISDSRAWMTSSAQKPNRLGPFRMDLSITIDPSTSPKSISIVSDVEPINKGDTTNYRQEMLGIYDLDSKRLKIRLMSPGTARPAEFLKESKDAPGQQCECVPLPIDSADERILKELRGLNPQYYINDAGKVVELNLSKTKVQDADLKLISQLPELTTLYLWDTAITDNAIPSIVALKQLTHLYLTETKVSDASVDQLASHQGLKLINLAGSQLTKAGADKLSELIAPRCELQWHEADGKQSKPPGQ